MHFLSVPAFVVAFPFALSLNSVLRSVASIWIAPAHRAVFVASTWIADTVAPVSLFLVGDVAASLRDAERRAGEVEASFIKQLRTVQERERSAGLAMERRLREEGEVAQRLSARNTDMQVSMRGGDQARTIDFFKEVSF